MAIFDVAKKSATRFTCEGCEHKIEIEASDPDQLRLILRRIGWSTVMLSEQWRHYCPRCW